MTFAGALLLNDRTATEIECDPHVAMKFIGLVKPTKKVTNTVYGQFSIANNSASKISIHGFKRAGRFGIDYPTLTMQFEKRLSQRNSWIVKAICLVLTLAPIVGPVFYLTIDPPESSPSAVRPEEFWQRGSTRVPKFDKLKAALRSIFVQAPDDH